MLLYVTPLKYVYINIENKIKKLRAQGYGVAKIAQAMGCSTSAVRKRLAMKKYISP